MRFRKLKLSAILLTGLGLTGLMAQESMNTAGGNASGSGGAASYSVGQVAYQTHTGAGGTIAEGAQQPYEISVVSAIEQAIGVKLLVAAYPNPTTGNLLLSTEEFELSNISYQLYDINGKVLQSGKITSDKTSLVMGNLTPATYYLKVIQDNKEVKTFKIVKQ